MNPRKRLFDLALSIPGLLALLPVLAIVAVLIMLQDRGPAFFLHRRVGLHGKPFLMVKFRTMVVDAEKTGGQLTVGKDQRITVLGKWLRATKVDELPQLLNVVLGHMSLVGPRPEVDRYVHLYTRQQRAVLEIMPGITDPASIRYRNESSLLGNSADPERSYVEQIMPEKIRINLAYAAKATLWSDMMIIVQTILPGISIGQHE